MAVYRGHLKDSLTASSNGGATVHAYGVKAPYASFGTDEHGNRPVAACGTHASLLHDAIKGGLPTGLVNSGSIIEPGTAAFAASVDSRSTASAEIAAQVIASGTDVILSGGEEWFLPEGVQGRFCASGKRKDNRHLIREARGLGYQVVFTLEELRGAQSQSRKPPGTAAVERLICVESAMVWHQAFDRGMPKMS